MASGPITSWQIDVETMEMVRDLVFWLTFGEILDNFWRDFGSKITEDGICSHEFKRHLLLGRKAMTNLDSMLKSRDYFTDKGLSSQSYGFSSSHVWMWELDYKDSWGPRNWFFWTVVLKKTLESPWTARRSNQSILMEISPEYSLKRLMLKL